MNCPHCQKELPDNSAAICPFCQQPLTVVPKTATPTTTENKSRYWLIFWLAFIGTPALTLLSLAPHVVPEILFLPLVGAVIAGFALAKIYSKETGIFFILKGILYSFGVVIIYIGILFVGCLVVATAIRP